MDRTIVTLKVCGWSSIGMGLIFFLIPEWYAELEGANTENISWLRNLGAALIAGAFMLGPTGFFTAEKLTTGVILAKSAVYLGASLVLSGVSEMLFPMPKPKEFKSEQDPQLSFSFSGTQNTSRAGTPVPIVYGEIVTGSVVISGAIDTQQVQA